MCLPEDIGSFGGSVSGGVGEKVRWVAADFTNVGAGTLANTTLDRFCAYRCDSVSHDNKSIRDCRHYVSLINKRVDFVANSYPIECHF